MAETNRALLIIAVVAICTFLTRVAPFVLFRGHKEPPKVIKYLGDILPMAVIAVLVVYCLKDIDLTVAASSLPALLAVLLVAVIHRWKRNNLLSIGAGTCFYMILIQLL